jgi:hypothetical protein
MELAVGYVDLQLDSYRNLIFLGALLGVMHRLPAIAKATNSEPGVAPKVTPERIAA